MCNKPGECGVFEYKTCRSTLHPHSKPGKRESLFQTETDTQSQCRQAFASVCSHYMTNQIILPSTDQTLAFNPQSEQGQFEAPCFSRLSLNFLEGKSALSIRGVSCWSPSLINHLLLWDSFGVQRRQLAECIGA